MPCYSGTTLPDLEKDDTIQQTVESLVDISRESLDIVAWALTEALEKLHKVSDHTSVPADTHTKPTFSQTAHTFSDVESLQSEVFLLKVLAIVMAVRWRRRGDDIRTPDAETVSRPTMSRATELSPAGSGGRAAAARGRNPSTDQLAAISPWIEPPPLDDNCARYILSVMILFLRQASPSQDRLMSAANINFNASYHDLESIDSADGRPLDIFYGGPDVPPDEDISSPQPESKQKFPAFMRKNPPNVPTARTSATLSQHSTEYEHTSTVICTSLSSLNTLIAKFAGRAVYHLSASNWPVVFWRMKSKIHVLASANEEDMEIMDVRLMMHCFVDRTRLVQLLQGSSSPCISAFVSLNI